MSNKTEFKPVTEETFKKIDAYVHQELGDEYDLDELGSILTELVDADEVSVSACISYLYAYEPLEYANQIVMDFFDSDVQKLPM